MEKFTTKLEELLVPVASKLSANRYLRSIMEGFSVLLPVIMIGAIFTLLANLQIGVYQDFISSIGLKSILSFAPTVTTDMLAVYASFVIGKACAKQIGIEAQSTLAGMMSLFVFFLMIPLGVSGTSASGEVVNIGRALSTQFLGAPGLFTAMILGLVVPTIYAFFIKKNITIKMPEQVPPTISKSFSALVPGFFIAILFCFIRYGFTLTSYGNLNMFIYTNLQAPLSQLGANPLTFVAFIIICSLMWFFGLHGGMVVMPFLNILYTPAGLENLDTFAQGIELTNKITPANWALYASLGGAGGTLGLCILMAFFSKSARYKALGKIALPSGLCGINEPVTFGLPVVLNPIVLIPFIIAPVVTFLISYACMSLGIIPLPNGAAIPLGTPVIFSGLIAVGWQAAVLQVGLILVQVGVYLPFFKILDKQALAVETEVEVRNI